MNNSGNLRSLIQGNTFSNVSSINGSDFVDGVYCTGNNKHLDIKCNTFLNMSNDIFLGSDITAILKNQTQNDKHNDNTFSNTTGNSRINIYNSGGTDFKINYDESDPELIVSGNVTATKRTNNNTCTFDNGCEELTKEIYVKAIKSALINVYPNPSKNILNIAIDQQLSTKATAQIYDILGNKIPEIYLSISKQIDVSKINSGIYFISINDASSVYTSKFVIQK